MRFIFLSLCFLFCHPLYSQSFSELYKKCSPSVVVIETEEKVEDEFGQVSYDGSFGTGVLIDDTGNILTAAHVVDKANYVRVKFMNGEVVPADLVRSAQVADVALIKLRWMPKEYTVAQLANSDLVEIGDEVAVIGTPYGLEYSLSRGIISARYEEKAKTNGFTFAEFFQTDAAINQGNSGGPMFNMDGEVIAIVSYIITESGGFQGLGFAATTNVCKKMVINNKRRNIGITGYWMNEDQCAIFNVPQKQALLIQNVVDLSPADIAGLKGSSTYINLFDEDLKIGGDIILSVNGVTLDSEDSFIEIFLSFVEMKNRDKFKIKILRGGEVLEKEINMKLD